MYIVAKCRPSVSVVHLLREGCLDEGLEFLIKNPGSVMWAVECQCRLQCMEKDSRVGETIIVASNAIREDLNLGWCLW